MDGQAVEQRKWIRSVSTSTSRAGSIRPNSAKGAMASRHSWRTPLSASRWMAATTGSAAGAAAGRADHNSAAQAPPEPLSPPPPSGPLLSSSELPPPGPELSSPGSPPPGPELSSSASGAICVGEVAPVGTVTVGGGDAACRAVDVGG
jgi:hypothetical protein